MVAGAVLAGLALVSNATAGPALGQSTSSSVSTSTTLRPATTTTAPVITTPPPTTPTTAPSTVPTSVTTSTTLATPVGQPAPVPVDSKTPDNAGEPPPTAVVPPRATPRIPTAVDQAVAKVLEGQARAAQQAADGALAASQAADLLLSHLEAEQAKQQRSFEALHADEAAAAQRLITQRQNMRTRAVAIYVSGPGQPVIPVGSDIQEYGRRRVLVQALYAADRRTLDQYVGAKKMAGGNVDAIVAGLETLNAKVIAARADSEAKAAAVQNGLRTVGTAQAQSIGPTAISGFAFPVAEPHNFIDSFGAPRSGGRSHEGEDIFAPYGTPLFACERGVIGKVGLNTLGGIKLWITGASGTSYYYAHLSAYAQGVADGTVVEPGDLVGYVGNSGDAITTPPHLHFEVHPGGGAAINSFAILKAADQATKLLAAQQPAPVIAPPTLPQPAATPAAATP